MQDKRNDLITRILVIVIFGTLAFSLLFNVFIGGGSMDHMGGMSGSGTSLDSFLANLLNLLVKSLLIILVIAVIIGVIVWIKNTFFKNSHMNFGAVSQAINKDPILKTVTVTGLALLGIILIISLFGGLSSAGSGMYGTEGMMNGTMGSYSGFNTAWSIGGLLQLLIKVLTFILVIALIMALVAYLKKLYDQGAFKTIRTTESQGSNQNVQSDSQNNRTEQ